MGTLKAALDWARRGFPVFPLVEDGKEPIHDKWHEYATTDEAAIQRMWTDPVLGMERNYNIGTLCTNLVVVDIDVKAGKDGYNEYAQIGGHYDTLVVQTPTGGFHCYFNAPDSSNAPLSRSIDIRSHNGYVLAPGSRITGYGTETYTVINDREMSWIPATIAGSLRPPYARAEVDNVVDLDTEAAIQAGIGYLQSAPGAVEGMRGDDTTFVTAARLVRELGLSVSAAFQLMAEHWNYKCSPPWPLDELLRKIENAAAYGTATAGRLTSEQLFGHLNVPPVPTVFEQDTLGWGNAFVPAGIRPRPWLVDRMLMRENVTLLMAAGSAGKSSISLALAAHLSLGLDFAGYQARGKCKTIVYNGEDDIEEQSRRLMATCMVYGFDYEEAKRNIMLLSPRQIKMDLVTLEGRRPVRNDALVAQFIAEASAPDVGLVILDPLVKIHKCDESDNVQMDYVMETLTEIAYKANVSVLALHHTAKGGNGKQEDRIGNMDIGRGASAIVNAARVAFTLLNASNQDAEDYGLKDDERLRWVRMDDAKMNLALASDKATWFYRDSAKIPSNDIVGVLRHEQLEKSQEHIKERVARSIIKTMEGIGAGSLKMPQLCAAVKTDVSVWATKLDAEVKRRIEGFYHIPYQIDGKTIVVERTMDDKKKETVLVVMR